MSRAFISYSRRNTNFAERLARDLTDAGVEVWIDFRQIHAGERWKDEIRRGIERSDVIIVVLSPDSVASEWVGFEIGYGREQGKIMLPVMAAESMDLLRASETLKWLLDVHFIIFENRYEQAFPELLKALPGKRRLGSFDVIDPTQIHNPFKGLEAFQQTDAAFFFGREQLVKKAISALKPGRPRRFLAVVGASGSGKSSLVRAGVIPQVRAGAIPGSDAWRVAIFTPAEQPVKSLATRLAPLLPEEIDADAVQKALQTGPDGLSRVAQRLMSDAPAGAMLLLVVDQFEETFTRATEAGAAEFITLLHHAATVQGGRCVVAITMRADFFDRLGKYPAFAELFEADQLLIVTEMTPSNLLRAITGPADAVGLIYEDGLADRILEDVRRQPGSLPLLQYALTELYQRRDGRRLTHAAYDAIGGVEQALARHAEGIYSRMGVGQQDTMRRILLRLIEVGEDGTATRRKVAREDLSFVGISDQAVQEIIDRLTAADSRLLVTSREIRTSADQTASATVWVEVGHEALIREWTRFQGWIAADLENLRLGADLLKAAADWQAARKDAAYLLTGTRLSHAEEWVDTADASAVQREFVRASVDERERREALERDQSARELTLQKRAADRLRAFVAVLAVALFVTAGVVLFALGERDRANQNSDLANQNAERANRNAELAEQNLARSNSFALSALADRALSDGDSEIAVALAVEANLIAASPPPQSSLTLADVAFAPGTRQNFEPSGAAITAVALSRDEQFVLAAGSDGVTLFDARSGNVIRTLGAAAITNASAVALSPDGATALVGTSTGIVTAYATTTGAEIKVWKSDRGRAINSLAFNSTGDQAVSADNNNHVILWDKNGAVVRTFNADRAVAAFWPLDEQVIISAGRDGQIIAWDSTDGVSVWRLKGTLPVLALALSPDGQFALTGGAGATEDASAQVALWGLEGIDPAADPVSTPTAFTDPLRVYAGHASQSQSEGVGFSADGARVVSAASDGKVLAWDTVSGDIVTSFIVSGDTDLHALAVSDDRNQAVSAGESDGAAVLRMWDLSSAAVVIDLSGHTGRTVGAFIPESDGIPRTVLTGGRDDPAGADPSAAVNSLRVFDIASGRTVQQMIGHTGLVVAVDASADGKFAVSGSQDQTVRVWDIATGVGQIVGQYDGTGASVNDVAFLPDGKSVVSISRNGKISLWGAAGEGLIREFSDPSDTNPSALQALTISPDGTLLLTGGDSRVIRLWEIASGALLGSVTIEDRAVRALAFSPDGTQFAAGSVNGGLTIWKFSLTGAVPVPEFALAQPTPSVFDRVTFQQVRALTGHSQAILSASFADNNTLLSTGFDGTMRVWDLGSGFEVRRFDTADEPNVTLQAATLSPDGQTVLTGLSDGRIRLWRLYPTLDSLLAWTKINRDVTSLSDCALREQFGLPACDLTGQAPDFVWPDLPVLNPPPETVIALHIGDTAVVNTTNGDRQLLRSEPRRSNDTATDRVDDGAHVILLDGPVSADGFWWWQVQTEGSASGWITEYIPDENIQSLVPLHALE